MDELKYHKYPTQRQFPKLLEIVVLTLTSTANAAGEVAIFSDMEYPRWPHGHELCSQDYVRFDNKSRDVNR